MKRARLHLTWDELLLVRAGLEHERAAAERELAQREDDGPLRRWYTERLDLVDELLPRVEKAIKRT